MDLSMFDMPSLLLRVGTEPTQTAKTKAGHPVQTPAHVSVSNCKKPVGAEHTHTHPTGATMLRRAVLAVFSMNNLIITAQCTNSSYSPHVTSWTCHTELTWRRQQSSRTEQYPG